MGKKINTTGIATDWQWEFKDDIFSLWIQPATHRLNFREACIYRAKELYESLKNPVISFSGGLDSQLVLHSFYEQGYKIDCIFRHFVNYNDNELENIKILQKRYGFKINIIEMNPYEYRDDILAEYEETDIPPNQLLYKKFYSLLPDDLDIIQGFDGPNVYQSKNELYYIETTNSYEFSRRRAINILNRRGKFVSFEKNSNLLLSTLSEEIYQIFCKTFNYFLHNQVEGIKVIDFWDTYVKPFVYYKHWKNELIYFPKYQGPEKIDWIMNGPKQQYKKNMITIPLPYLNEVLIGNDTIKFQQNVI